MPTACIDSRSVTTILLLELDDTCNLYIHVCIYVYIYILQQIRQICDYAAKHKDNIAQDLKDIPGIGAAAKRKLVANGITNVIQLETSMEELLKKSGDIVCAIEEFLQWLTNNGLRVSVWTKVAALAIGHKVQKMNPESVTKYVYRIQNVLQYFLRKISSTN